MLSDRLVDCAHTSSGWLVDCVQNIIRLISWLWPHVVRFINWLCPHVDRLIAWLCPHIVRSITWLFAHVVRSVTWLCPNIVSSIRPIIRLITWLCPSHQVDFLIGRQVDYLIVPTRLSEREGFYVIRTGSPSPCPSTYTATMATSILYCSYLCVAGSGFIYVS